MLMDTAQETLLIKEAQNGSLQAIEELICTYKDWLFNFVLRMVGNYHHAEDLSQDILLKIFQKITTFRGESQFKTWLFRIAVNHVLTMKQTEDEKYHKVNQNNWADDEYMTNYLQQDVPDNINLPPDMSLMVKETMVKCMMGMLVCLNRRHRAVYIMGSILSIDDQTGSKILEITKDNYRKILSRSHMRITNFLNDRCGLINPKKPCTCAIAAKVNIHTGYIDPLKTLFHKKKAPEMREMISDAQHKLDNIRFEQCQELYRKHPLVESPEFSQQVINILKGNDFQSLLTLGLH